MFIGFEYMVGTEMDIDNAYWEYFINFTVYFDSLPGLESLSIEKKSLYNQIVLYDNFQNLILDNMIHTPDEYQIFQEDIKAHYEKSKDMIFNRLKIEYQKVISRKPYTIHSGVYNYSIVIDYNNLNIKFDNYFKL